MVSKMYSHIQPGRNFSQYLLVCKSSLPHKVAIKYNDKVQSYTSSLIEDVILSTKTVHGIGWLDTLGIYKVTYLVSIECSSYGKMDAETEVSLLGLS